MVAVNLRPIVEEACIKVRISMPHMWVIGAGLIYDLIFQSKNGLFDVEIDLRVYP
jgi:hypothetical protein